MKSDRYIENEFSKFLYACIKLKIKFFDSHCHLDFLFQRTNFVGSFSNFFISNIEHFPANFAGCIAVFCNPITFTNFNFANYIDDRVWLAMGCHPKKVIFFNKSAEDNLWDLLKKKKVIAVGETGLDYSGNFFRTANLQKKIFIIHIKMALALKKPIVIHCRDADDDCLQILRTYIPRNHHIHLHCYTKSFQHAKEWLYSFPNLFIGLTPLITYPSAHDSHDTAQKIPLNRLLLETDAPYFVPRCLPSQIRTTSHPGMAVTVAFEVAKLKNVSTDLVLRHCFANTIKMYNIDF